MSPARASRAAGEPRRFGRFGMIPTPLPPALPVGHINAYLIFPATGDGPLTLVDTGIKTPAAFEALRRGVAALGGSLERVERILITHAHMDHCGQAARLRELSGARVYASAPEAEAMKTHFSPTGRRDPATLAWFRRWGVPDAVASGSRGLSHVAREMMDPLEVDGLLEDGDRVDLGDGALEVLATPGHCDGHLVFWEPESRTLCAGDHLLPDISPVPLLSIPRREGEPRPKSLLRYAASLSRVEQLDCALALPAHGDVIRDHRRLIASYRLHHERRALQLSRTLREGPLTPFEVAARMFPKQVASQLYLVLSEVIGHLELLEEQGRVELELRGGVEYARLASQPAEQATRCG